MAESNSITFDQAGNVWEWMETIQNGPGLARVMRGGGYANGLGDFTVSSFQSGASPESKFHSGHGFRVAMVPEPSTLALTGANLVVIAFLAWVHRRRTLVRSI